MLQCGAGGGRNCGCHPETQNLMATLQKVAGPAFRETKPGVVMVSLFQILHHISEG